MINQSENMPHIKNVTIGLLIFYVVFVVMLSVERSIFAVSFYYWLAPIFFIPLLYFLFRIIGYKLWGLLLYSLIAPLSILYSLHSINLPGLGKAKLFEQLIILAIIWFFIFLLSLLGYYFFRNLRKDSN